MKILKRRLQLGALLTFVPIVPAILWWSTSRPTIAHDPPMRIAVSLSARQLKVIEGGDVVQTYGIAIGRPSHPTPTGSFRTGVIDWNPSWTPPPSDWARNKEYQPPGSPDNPMQGVKIYFRAPYYFIHGTNNPGSIGEAASHGCIRMTAEDATALARRIQRAGGGVPLTISE
ncbi:MAG TPA: L,D-transpeptidase [Gemmatimonadaceae bacterium]